MKKVEFHKYFEDENRNLHFWECTTLISLEDAEKIKKEINLTIPTADVTLIQNYRDMYLVNVKIFNSEDNGLFCIKIGGV